MTVKRRSALPRADANGANGSQGIAFDRLLHRAEAAVAESRRLADDRLRILELMSDTAAHRRMVAEDFARWTQAAEGRCAHSGRQDVRSGREIKGD
jgi:hypothetical protein